MSQDRCPACIVAATVREHLTADPLRPGEELYGYAWCMGAAHAFAATHHDHVFRTFALCAEHGRTVVEAMGDYASSSTSQEKPS